MKKQILFILSFLLLFLILYSLSGLRQKSKIVKKIYLKASSIQDSNYPTIIGLLKIKELLNKWTDGRIIVEVYPSAQLGSEIDTILQTQLGLINFNVVNVNSLIQIVKELKVLTLPYLFRDEDHLWKVLNGKIGDELLMTLENYDLIGLGFYDSGQQSLYNNRKNIISIEDLKDLKIRVPNNEIMIDMIKAFGAIPIPMEYNEVYSAINSGLLDGAEGNELFYYSKNHYKIAKYYSYNEHSRIPEIILMNKKFWYNLTNKDKELIIKAVKESIQFQREILKKQVNDVVKKCKDAGCNFNIIVNKESFKKVIEQIHQKHASDLLDLVNTIKSVK